MQHLSIGVSRPTLKLLQSGNITVKASSKWYELGIELLDDDQLPQLRVIAANYNDVTRQCSEMFIYWLQTHPNATWYQLVSALRAPGIAMHDVATTLEGSFIGQPTASSTPPRQDSVGTISNQEVATQTNEVASIGATNSALSFAHFATVREAFAYLTSKMRSHLAKADICDLRRVCIEQMSAPSGAQLSPDLLTKVKSSQNITALFDALAESPCWSWIDIRLLSVMAAASGHVATIELLENYRQSVFSRKLIDVIPNAPSKNVKHEYYSKLVTKLDKDANALTVADLLEFQPILEKVILDINNGVCVLEHIEGGCIVVHWFIPTHCVDDAYKSARQRCDKFEGISLLYLQIGDYQIIHGAQNKNGVIVPTSPLVTTVKDFIDHYFNYLSVSMNSEVVAKLMISQALISEDIVMTAQSCYHKNHIILEQVRLMDAENVMSVCELLKGEQSHKDIGEFLLNEISHLLSKIYSIGEQANQDDPTTVSKKDKSVVDSAPDSSSLVVRFLDMKVQVNELLQVLDPKKIVDNCSLLKANVEADIPLFSTSFVSILQQRKSVLSLLSPYTNWCNHSILNAIVEVCNVPEAANLIAQFDAKIDPSQPLMKYPIPSPSYHMVPYDTSTHTVLAVQLNLQLHHSTLQDILDTQSMLQHQCRITAHCMQLLAVANISHTIIYWTIPKHVAGLITSGVLQHQNYLHQNGIQQVAVYPGTVLVTGSALTVGLFSFFTEVISPNTSDNLNAQLYQLEEIPNNITKLQVELLHIRREQNAIVEELKQIVVKINQEMKSDPDVTKTQPLDQELFDFVSSCVQGSPSDLASILKMIQSKLDQLIIQLRHSKVSEICLKDKILKEKQKYFNLWSRYRESQSIAESSQVMLDASKQEECENLEELPKSHVLDADTMTELTKLQLIMEDVSTRLVKIDLIKKHWNEKATTNTQSLVHKNADVKDSVLVLQSEETPLLIQLKKLHSNLKDVEEWTGLFNLLQTELLNSHEKIKHLETKVRNTEINLSVSHSEAKHLKEEMKFQQAQQEKSKVITNKLKDELSEKESQLMMKENELKSLKKDNQLLGKQFREMKDRRRKEILIPQNRLVQQELLGGGRYGEVWRISYGDKTYAGKIFHKTLLPGYPDMIVNQINQFVAEIESISATFSLYDHPNIEKFITVAQLTADDTPTLLSEILPGNLNNFTATMKGKLPVILQIELCNGMAKGIQFLHANGVIHNNLHGGNVLITQDGQAKIADYICPQIAELNEKSSPQQKAYMCNEVAKNPTLYSKSSDIYSLGIIFLQVATQSPPTPHIDVTLSDIQKHKLQLDKIASNPLLSVIVQCLNIPPARPSIENLCDRLCGTLQHAKDLLSGQLNIKWEEGVPAPVRRAYHTSVLLEGKVYIGGGFDGRIGTTFGTDSYRIDIYTPASNSWSPSPIKTSYCQFAMTSFNNQLITAGGRDRRHKVTNKIFSLYSDKLKDYTMMFTPRWGATAAGYQKTLIIAGGENDQYGTRASTELFDSTTGQFYTTEDIPLPHYGLQSVIVDNMIYLLGGVKQDGKSSPAVYTAPLDTLSSHQLKWSSHQSTPWSRSAPVSIQGGYLITVGGSKKAGSSYMYTSDIHMLYKDSDRWNVVGQIPSARRAPTAISAADNKIVVIGGENEQDQYTNNVWIGSCELQ